MFNINYIKILKNFKVASTMTFLISVSSKVKRMCVSDIFFAAKVKHLAKK